MDDLDRAGDRLDRRTEPDTHEEHRRPGASAQGVIHGLTDQEPDPHSQDHLDPYSRDMESRDPTAHIGYLLRTAPDWDYLHWLRDHWQGHLIVKGVLTEADARRAVKEDVDAIVVSNHGGRRLDGMPASIDRMQRVAETVDGKAELLLDSGIRRGTDVLKALALGARAVPVGRPQAWSLSAAGQQGVGQMLEFFREELENAMISCGCRNVGDISSNLLLDAPPVD